MSEVLNRPAACRQAHRLKNRESKTFKSLKAFWALGGDTPPPSPTAGRRRPRFRRPEPAHCVLMTGTPLQNNTVLTKIYIATCILSKSPPRPASSLPLPLTSVACRKNFSACCIFWTLRPFAIRRTSWKNSEPSTALSRCMLLHGRDAPAHDTAESFKFVQVLWIS
jgi:hypothetical protein